MPTEAEVRGPAEVRAAIDHLGDRERDALHALPGTRRAFEHLGDRERDALHRIRESVVDLRDGDLTPAVP